MKLRPPNRRSSTPSPHPPIEATSNDGVLPLDLLYDILLRLPAESLCRFRAVCRSWQSLLCHPEFTAVVHNPGHLLLAVGINNYTSSNQVDVVDMESGDVVRQVNVAAAPGHPLYGVERVMSHDHLVCVAKWHHRLRVLDLSTGAVTFLPDHAPPLVSTTTCTVWRGASTGEHKVLAIVNLRGVRQQQVCKILNLRNIGGGWRDTGSPPLKVVTHAWGVAVVNGVAYFRSVLHSHQIMRFDLIGEAWLQAYFQGPVFCRDITLAELEGHLAVSYTLDHPSFEVWFLMDSDRSLWSKRYNINMALIPVNRQTRMRYDEYFEKPLAVLGDGRIVLWMRLIEPGIDTQDALLRIYDPRTGTFTVGTWVPNCNRFIVLAWSLLHPAKSHGLAKVARRLLIGRRHHRSGSPTSVRRAKRNREQDTSSDLIPGTGRN